MSKPQHCPECGAILDDPRDHSDPARRRFFAIIREVWQTLPDDVAKHYASSEHLRKAALIHCGWCESITIAAGSKTAALEIAAKLPQLDRYAIARPQGSIVEIFTARSIAKRACPKAQFMPLSEKVYTWLSQLVGSDVEASIDARKAT